MVEELCLNASIAFFFFRLMVCSGQAFQESLLLVM